MTHWTGRAGVALAGLVVTGMAAAEPAGDARLAGPSVLIGEWRGDCDAWGTPGSCRLTWSEGLHGDHLTVRYQIREAQDEAVIFQGQGVYRIGEAGALSGYWSDSQGAIHRLSASWRDDALTTHWGEPGEGLGRTRYGFDPDGGLTVTDWVLDADGWAPFMHVQYERVE